MYKLDDYQVNFNNYTGREALESLLKVCGVDEILDGINEYFFEVNRYSHIYTIEGDYTIVSKDNKLHIVIK
jgi:hypothetical protein